jgi:hypothetical protein
MNKKRPTKRSKGAPKKREPASKRESLKKTNDDLLGFMAGQFEIVGDIESPIPDWAHWRPAKNL